MVLNQIMCILKILTDLCVMRQKIKTKNIFSDIAYNALAVKEFW